VNYVKKGLIQIRGTEDEILLDQFPDGYTLSDSTSTGTTGEHLRVPDIINDTEIYAMESPSGNEINTIQNI
jgi:hypothetical protein